MQKTVKKLLFILFFASTTMPFEAYAMITPEGIAGILGDVATTVFSGEINQTLGNQAIKAVAKAATILVTAPIQIAEGVITEAQLPEGMGTGMTTVIQAVAEKAAKNLGRAVGTALALGAAKLTIQAIESSS